jgi:O-antigen/teichoic acid export membrane protein
MSVEHSQIKRRSLAMNSMFSVIAWMLPIFLGFVATPVLVRNLGSVEYGLFAIILGFISYSFTFGIGKVAGKYVPEFEATGERTKVTQVIAATFWFSLGIGALGALALILTAPWIVTDVLLIEPAMIPTAVWALYLAALIGLAVMVSQVFQFVLQGLHRFDNYVALTNLNGLLVGIGNIVLAINGFGVTALLAWNLTIVCFVGLLFYLRVRHLLPTIRLLTTVPSELIRSVGHYSGSIILYQIFANVLFIFERSWVMRKFGAEALTFYFVPMLLAIYMHGFVSSIVQAVFPVVNELLEDRSRVRRLYERANKIILAIVVFSVANFIACGELFLKLWIGPDLAIKSYEFLVPHGLTFGLIAFGIMSFQLAEAYKFPGRNVLMNAAWTVIAIPLMIFTAGPWQLGGVAWSRFGAALVTVPFIAYTERRALGQVVWRFWLASGIRILAAAIAMVIVERLILSWISDSYLSLIVAGTLGGVVFAGLIAVTGYLDREDRQIISQRLFRRLAVAEPPAAGE